MPKAKQKRRTRGRKRRDSGSTSDPTPLDDFFVKYFPECEYHSTESASHEFYRLCDHAGWDRDDPEREGAHQAFKNALVQQFNKVYGTNADSLADWQNLCYIVRIDPIPEDLDACREAIRGTFVNLVDLVDTDTTGENVEVFGSESELSEYTRSTGKIFPKQNAYTGGLLRYLLRRILHPATEAPSRRRFKKRR